MAEIPELPSVIRYYDDFLDEFHSIQNPINDIWIIFDQGTKESLNFGAFEGGLRPLLKLWCCNQIQTLSIGTARTRFQRLRCIALDDLLLMLSSTPVSARSNWNVLMSHNYSARDMDALKSILYYFCKSCIAGWSTHYEKFLSTLPLPVYDKYASVRGGDVFLAVEEEAALVTHIDSINEKVVLSPQSIADDMLRHTAILLCAFQFGLRPMQIGMLRMRDVRIWTESDSSIASVHLTFKMIKQRSSSKAFPLPRRVKREWAPLFVELHARAQRSGMSATDHFFGVSSASETGSIITRMTAKLLAESRSATELRHTAAQRLVDAGANQEELAEFLGHSDIDTGLIYFQTSANQAERVNKALGISPIYQQVAKIAHARFIDKGELAELKGDRQIGAVPHGIPISGIGACAVGQPACPSNPVTACYGCIKFMPLNDPEIHKQVLADFRSVVTFFSEASMGDDNSPAYLQLRRTISNVQAIIEELEGKTDE
ncbi:MAG: tyrosine-type recombinase/integrase [Rhodobacteraceae bacterium]|nr:tyrosine-type recombinase/integrase [Paracoccaceae bacterium]